MALNHRRPSTRRLLHSLTFWVHGKAKAKAAFRPSTPSLTANNSSSLTPARYNTVHLFSPNGMVHNLLISFLWVCNCIREMREAGDSLHSEDLEIELRGAYARREWLLAPQTRWDYWSCHCSKHWSCWSSGAFPLFTNCLAILFYCYYWKELENGCAFSIRNNSNQIKIESFFFIFIYIPRYNELHCLVQLLTFHPISMGTLFPLNPFSKFSAFFILSDHFFFSCLEFVAFAFDH